jgi:hypothetical protein
MLLRVSTFRCTLFAERKRSKFTIVPGKKADRRGEAPWLLVASRNEGDERMCAHQSGTARAASWGAALRLGHCKFGDVVKQIDIKYLRSAPIQSQFQRDSARRWRPRGAASRQRRPKMKMRSRLFACLGTLVAILGSRDGANAAQKAEPSNVSTAVLYTDGMIIRLAQDDESEPEPGAKHRSPE